MSLQAHADDFRYGSTAPVWRLKSKRRQPLALKTGLSLIHIRRPIHVKSAQDVCRGALRLSDMNVSEELSSSVQQEARSFSSTRFTENIQLFTHLYLSAADSSHSTQLLYHVSHASPTPCLPPASPCRAL